MRVGGTQGQVWWLRSLALGWLFDELLGLHPFDAVGLKKLPALGCNAEINRL